MAYRRSVMTHDWIAWFPSLSLVIFLQKLDRGKKTDRANKALYRASQNPNYQLSDVHGTGVLHQCLVPIILFFVCSFLIIQSIYEYYFIPLRHIIYSILNNQLSDFRLLIWYQTSNTHKTQIHLSRSTWKNIVHVTYK